MKITRKELVELALGDSNSIIKHLQNGEFDIDDICNRILNIGYDKSINYQNSDSAPKMVKWFIDRKHYKEASMFITSLDIKKEEDKKYLVDWLQNINNVHHKFQDFQNILTSEFLLFSIDNGYLDFESLNEDVQIRLFKESLKNGEPLKTVPQLNHDFFKELDLNHIVHLFIKDKIDNAFMSQIIRKTNLNKLKDSSFPLTIIKSFFSGGMTQKEFKDLPLALDILKHLQRKPIDDDWCEIYSDLKGNLMNRYFKSRVYEKSIYDALEAISRFPNEEKKAGKIIKKEQEIHKVRQEMYLPFVEYLVDKIQHDLHGLNETINGDLSKVSKYFYKLVKHLDCLLTDVSDLSKEPDRSLEIIKKMYKIESDYRETMSAIGYASLLNLVFHRFVDKACENDIIREYADIHLKDKIEEVYNVNIQQLNNKMNWVKRSEDDENYALGDFNTFKVRTSDIEDIVFDSGKMFDFAELSKNTKLKISSNSWRFTFNEILFSNISIVVMDKQYEYSFLIYQPNIISYKIPKDRMDEYVEQANEQIKSGKITKEQYENLMSYAQHVQKVNNKIKLV
jgi:hypothetical protein